MKSKVKKEESSKKRQLFNTLFEILKNTPQTDECYIMRGISGNNFLAAFKGTFTPARPGRFHLSRLLLSASFLQIVSLADISFCSVAMASRKRTLLKVIILGDSGYSSLLFPSVSSSQENEKEKKRNKMNICK